MNANRDMASVRLMLNNAELARMYANFNPCCEVTKAKLAIRKSPYIDETSAAVRSKKHVVTRIYVPTLVFCTRSTLDFFNWVINQNLI